MNSEVSSVNLGFSPITASHAACPKCLKLRKHVRFAKKKKVKISWADCSVSKPVFGSLPITALKIAFQTRIGQAGRQAPTRYFFYMDVRRKGSLHAQEHNAWNPVLSVPLPLSSLHKTIISIVKKIAKQEMQEQRSAEARTFL